MPAPSSDGFGWHWSPMVGQRDSDDTLARGAVRGGAVSMHR